MWKRSCTEPLPRRPRSAAHPDDPEAERCRTDCSTEQCTYVGPAACYKAEGNGAVLLITDGCLECGSCRIICDEHRNVAWEYPRGGHGILFKFG